SSDHDRPSSRYVPWVVTPPYFHPDSCQIGGASGVVITTGDRYALLFSEEGQATHPGSGDPHEVDRAGIHRGKQVHQWGANIANRRNLRKRPPMFHGISVKIFDTISRAASGCPRPRARVPRDSSRARSETNAVTS